MDEIGASAVECVESIHHHHHKKNFKRNKPVSRNTFTDFLPYFNALFIPC